MQLHNVSFLDFPFFGFVWDSFFLDVSWASLVSQVWVARFLLCCCCCCPRSWDLSWANASVNNREEKDWNYLKHVARDIYIFLEIAFDEAKMMTGDVIFIWWFGGVIRDLRLQLWPTGLVLTCSSYVIPSLYLQQCHCCWKIAES